MNESNQISSSMGAKASNKMLASPKELLRAFKEKLKARGARGVLGLQKTFKLMDFDGSGTISF